MLTNYKQIAAVIIGALLAGCTANGTASPPTSAVTNLQQNSVLQFAVGTANIGQTGTVGLNTVSTFRQTNGLSATLVNTPTITGSAGFTVPPVSGVSSCAASVPACSSAAGDAGTNHISAAPQNVNPGVANPSASFGQAGGVFSYGIAPDNESTTGGVVYARYTNPLFSGSTSSAVNLNYGGGPPAYPFFKDGTYPGGFSGYSQGFNEINAAPVAGTYTLSDVVATGNAGTLTFTASATLANVTPLPALPTPTFAEDGLGGGSGVVTVPVDARVVETMVYFVNLSQGTFFAVGPIRGTGPQTYTLPDFLGPCSGASCQNNASTRRPTFTPPNPPVAPGDTYRIYAATYDYPMFEASPPGNVQQAPTITGGAATSNQADITTSASATFVY